MSYLNVNNTSPHPHTREPRVHASSQTLGKLACLPLRGKEVGGGGPLSPETWGLAPPSHPLVCKQSCLKLDCPGSPCPLLWESPSPGPAPPLMTMPMEIVLGASATWGCTWRAGPSCSHLDLSPPSEELPQPFRGEQLTRQRAAAVVTTVAAGGWAFPWNAGKSRDLVFARTSPCKNVRAEPRATHPSHS